MRENVLIYTLVALIFGLAIGAMYVEWSLGWLDWIEAKRSSRLRASYFTGIFLANVIAAGVVVFIPVQILAPQDKETASE